MKIVRRTRIAVRTDERLLIRRTTTVSGDSIAEPLRRGVAQQVMDRRQPEDSGGWLGRLLHSLARIAGRQVQKQKENTL